MPPESKYEGHKVSQSHLSALMKSILLSADGGTQRGEITANFYGLTRRYCGGYYVEACLRGREKHRYDRRYRRAQPAISKALGRLEERGLVRLVRFGRYVKEVFLTEKGTLLAQKLSQSGSGNQSR
jgi:hypothetical protein